MSIAIFGAGCFWCVEAIFSQLEGVTNVESGYTGGLTNNPTYESICSGTTNHAEVCKISFNQDIITFEELLKLFFKMHDPTTLNQQGADIGTQYRSAIFYTDKEQKEISENYIKSLNDNKIFSNDIVTQIEKFDIFYKAEDYHQDYYKNNKNAPYCRVMIEPKLEKLFKK